MGAYRGGEPVRRPRREVPAKVAGMPARIMWA